MKRTFLSVLGILALAMVGSVMAQTDYGSQDQPGSSPPSSTTAESPTPQGLSDTPSGSPTSTSGSMSETPTHESLPATASNLPLALVMGVSAIGTVVAIRAYRLHQAH